jgi:hypothetical protein
MNPAGRTLHDRFQEVCLTELHRLRRKTASLPPERRAEVDALSIEVAQGIAWRLSAALEHLGNDTLTTIVLRLFTTGRSDGSGRSAELPDR